MASSYTEYMNNEESRSYVKNNVWLISQSHFSLISLPKFPHNNSLGRTKLNAPETSLEIQTGPEEFMDQIPTHGLKSSCR
ncbi:hypothetical protein Peur_059996 [Populus x canadensis]